MSTTIQLASLTPHSSSATTQESILGDDETSPDKELQTVWCLGLPLDKTLDELFDVGNSMTPAVDHELAAAYSAGLWTLCPSPADVAVINECVAYNAPLRDASQRKNILDLLKQRDYEYRMVPLPELAPFRPNCPLPKDIYQGEELIRKDWAVDALPLISVRAAVHPAFAIIHADCWLHWAAPPIQTCLDDEVTDLIYSQWNVRTSSPPTLEEYEAANDDDD
ncbi:hypothetical protein MIND_00840200 [Mycena indigotica]|uniref:Uncharacterized protein n=1 Tax=Mycena indigotica TaxID=2126181 RepID=A0A8H6VYX9_9AGAR|nr:uncharacterized protein MIND_00840200 [Mycena indigotica]KAF7298922.1 hypothetical protein MIND_00840200 [Mycena indigotica]